MENSLVDKSYRYLRKKLSSGGYPPGSRLVNRTLATEIGVSVIPVREAIRRLASEGLVDHVPGAGAFVRNPNRQDLDDLYVLRDALESCAAAEAARCITQEQLEELEAIIENARQTAALIEKQPKKHANKKLLDRWLGHELVFHRRLIEVSRNALLAKVVEDHRAISQVFESQRNNPQLVTVAVAQRTCVAKSELVQALRDRNPDRARQLMSAQIQQGRKIVISFLASRSQTD